MSKEQELVTMMKYLCKQRPSMYVETYPNIFLLKYITVPLKRNYTDKYDHKMINVDVNNKKVTWSDDYNRHCEPVEWDLFMERIYPVLSDLVKYTVKHQILEEKLREKECILNRRIAFELQSVNIGN